MNETSDQDNRIEQDPQEDRSEDPGRPGQPTNEPRGNDEAEQESVEEGQDKLDRISGN